MRIIRAQRTGVQSLGRQAPGTTGYEGEVKVAEAITGAAVTAIETAGEYFIERQQIRTDRQIQQAKLYSQKSDNEFWERWGDREFFDVDELPKEVVTDGMRVKGRVMSAEVLPQMYQNHMELSLGESSKIIENEVVRDRWKLNADEIFLGRLQNIQTTADNKIQEQIIADQTINIDNALLQERPDVAIQIANDMDISDDEKSKLKTKIYQTAEKQNYADMRAEEEIDEIIGAIDFLSQDFEDYQNNGGQLDPIQRDVEKNKLESTLTGLRQVNGAANKANLELIRRELKIVTSNALDGKEIDGDEIVDLQRRAITANVKGDLTAEIMDLNRAYEFSVLSNKQNKYNRFDRERFIDQVDRDSNLSTFEKDQMVSRLQSASDNQTSAENSDMMQSWFDAGYEPVELDLSSMDGMVQSFADRKVQHDIAFANRGVSQGIFTQDEAKVISSILNSQTPEEQLSFVTAIASTFGRESPDVFEPLRLNSGSGILSVAGMVTLYGNSDDASHILKGNNYIRNNPDEVKNLQKLLALKIDQTLGTAYRYNDSYRNAIKESITAAYVSLARDSGESFDTVDSGGIFSFGDNLYDRAVAAATGGILSQSGVMIAPPKYGMGQDSWDDYINRLKPEHIDNLGGVKELSSERFLNGLRDGDYKLIDYKHGEYLVQKNDTTYVESSEFPGQPFVFVYDDDAPLNRKSRTSTEIRTGIEGLTAQEMRQEILRSGYRTRIAPLENVEDIYIEMLRAREEAE